MSIFGELFYLQTHQILQNFLHQFVLTEAVDQIHTGIRVPQSDHPVNDIKIRFQSQQFIQILHVLLQLFGNSDWFLLLRL